MMRTIVRVGDKLVDCDALRHVTTTKNKKLWVATFEGCNDPLFLDRAEFSELSSKIEWQRRAEGGPVI